MSMITAAAWVPRGYAAAFPKKYEFDDREFERIAGLARLNLDDAKEDLEEAKAEASGAVNEDTGLNDKDLEEYDLENYDAEDPDTAEGQTMGMFGNVRSLAYHESNGDDPYITLGAQDDEDDDRDDLQVRATDNLVIAAKAEDELANLEIYVYDDEEDNLYVHHDIMLPAIPLCLEWLDISVGKSDLPKDSRANFVAVGTMDPDIEIWDLDTMDLMYPNAILGQGRNSDLEKSRKKKKKKSKKANDEYHVDAILSLAANRQHRNLLASASADKTVKLWDLHTTKCAKSYSNHTDKVCSLAWHAVDTTILLSGSYDRTVVAADMRAPDAKPPRWGVESDVENVRWDPHDPNFFFVSTENGVIHYHDVRNAPSDPTATKAVWTLQAHDESISSFDINSVIPGFMVTGSTDKTVKLWNIQPTGPTAVVTRNLDVGKVFSTAFAPDAEVAFRLVVAGSKGTMTVWDTSTNVAVRNAFATKLPEKTKGAVEERLIGVDAGESSSSDEEEDEDGEEGGAGLGKKADEDEDEDDDEDKSMGED